MRQQPFIQRYGESLILLGVGCMVFSLRCQAVLQVCLAGGVAVIVGVILRFGTLPRAAREKRARP